MLILTSTVRDILVITKDSELALRPGCQDRNAKKKNIIYSNLKDNAGGRGSTRVPPGRARKGRKRTVRARPSVNNSVRALFYSAMSGKGVSGRVLVQV
jgi:hypothetical protein